jgi:hypothetical protein
MRTSRALSSALCGCTLILGVPTVLAQDLQPFVVGGMDINRDSDDFHAESYNAGAGVRLSDRNAVDRIGYRHSEIEYSSPGFHATGSGDSLFAARKLGAIDLAGEITQSRLDNGREEWLGWAQISSQPSPASNVELRYEKNWIDSSNALNAGVTYSMLSAAGDYQLTPRWNVAGVLARLDFSDGNDRPLYRVKTSWVVSEQYGISIYARARTYTNSEPYGGYYFAPERFEDYLGGIGLRRRLPIVRGTLSAQLDWGRQIVDGAASPAHTWNVRLESWPGMRWSYAIVAGYNATAGVGGGENYEYRYASASLTWMF